MWIWWILWKNEVSKSFWSYYWLWSDLIENLMDFEETFLGKWRHDCRPYFNCLVFEISILFLSNSSIIKLFALVSWHTLRVT